MPLHGDLLGRDTGVYIAAVFRKDTGDNVIVTVHVGIAYAAAYILYPSFVEMEYTSVKYDCPGIFVD